MKTVRGVMVVMSMAMMVAASAAQTSSTKIVDAKDDLFAGTEVFAKNATDVTEITMDPDTLGMVGGKARNMILNVVRTYEYDKPGMYRIEDVEAFRNKLNTGDWHCSVHTRSLKSGESTDVCEKRRTDDLKEQAIITVEPKELTFIHTIRKRGENESDVDGMLMFNSGEGFPMLAMLGPKLALMEARLATMPAMHPFPAIPPMPKFDPAQLQRNMADAQKQMEAAGVQLKTLNSPEVQQQIKDAEKNGGVILNLEPQAPEQKDAAPEGAK